MPRPPQIPLLLLAVVVALACTRSPAPNSSEADPNASASRPWAGPGARGPEAEIYRAWMQHLMSKASRYSGAAGARSEDWLPSEQQRWPAYELASLYLPEGATPEVLTIRPEPGLDGEYRVVTAFDLGDEYNTMRSKVVRMTVFARRSGGRWMFGNALPRLTRSWRSDTVGPITYVMEPDYHYDRDRAKRAAAFVDSVATAFNVPRLDHITYYLTSSEDEVTRIIGLETDKKWGPVGGLSQPVNHLLFSGMPSLGEDYRHELTHLVIMPLFLGHATPYLISEGVPTWLGGTTGMDFPTAARGLAEFLTQHPEVTLDTLMSRQSPVVQFYPAGAVFVDMTYRRGGTQAVKALFDAGLTNEAFRVAAEASFHEPWRSIAADWRAHALSFLATASPR